MVPEFTYFMLPLLEFLSDKKVHSSDECVDGVCEILNLSPDDLRERVRKGNRTKVVDRTQWSKTYLGWAELVRTERRGYYVITDKGLELLAKNPKHIDRNFLIENYPNFVINSKSKKEDSHNKKLKASTVPQMDSTRTDLSDKPSDTLLDILKTTDPYCIARVLCKILNSIGYYCQVDELLICKSSIQGKFFLDPLKVFPAFLFVNISSQKVTRNDVGQVLQLMYDNTCNSALYLVMNEMAEDARRFNAPSTNIKTMDIKHLVDIVVEKGIGVDIVERRVLNPHFFTE
ncbi:MAG TPA: winged helix-turn-helix domain-containing protein [Rectinema sp.]|nr:winged helix-turn-helix domain-containing protein [Rectinema sp.]